MDTRNVEIKSFIEKYKDVLKALQMDIAHAEVENRWFLFKHDPIFDSGYEFFLEIHNEKQLIESIISELSYEMHAEIGIDDVDTPECEKNDISEMVSEFYNKDCLAELTAILTYIKENLDVKGSILMKKLDNLLEDEKRLVSREKLG